MMEDSKVAWERSRRDAMGRLALYYVKILEDGAKMWSAGGDEVTPLHLLENWQETLRNGEAVLDLEKELFGVMEQILLGKSNN